MAALPVAVYLTRYAAGYELLDAAFAIPVAAALALVALVLARRSRRLSALRLGPTQSGPARLGRILGIVGLCMAASALVSIAVYGLLDYVGSRD